MRIFQIGYLLHAKKDANFVYVVDTYVLSNLQAVSVKSGQFSKVLKTNVCGGESMFSTKPMRFSYGASIYRKADFVNPIRNRVPLEAPQ